MIGGKVLDTSAVLDIADAASIYGQALLIVGNELGITLAVPAMTYSQAWQQSRSVNERRWLDLIITDVAEPSVVIVRLTSEQARDAGILAAHAGRPTTPLGTVHATHLARTRQWPVVTRDPMPVLALAPDVRTETIP